MEDEQQKHKRPPYASAGDLQAFFDRMGNMQEPSRVDNEWVESFNLAAAQPTAIVSVLKWLGIVDQSGASLGVWDEVRVHSSRQAKLEELVRESYSAIFNQFEDVSKATTNDLRGAFIRAYKSGDPGRHITCFIALCNIAGILMAPEAKGRERKAGSGTKTPTPKKASTPATPRAKKPRPAGDGRARGDDGPFAVTVSFNVEVPAEWTEEQIKERYEAIRRATSEGVDE
jgi:hypothetical protein